MSSPRPAKKASSTAFTIVLFPAPFGDRVHAMIGFYDVGGRPHVTADQRVMLLRASGVPGFSIFRGPACPYQLDPFRAGRSTYSCASASLEAPEPSTDVVSSDTTASLRHPSGQQLRKPQLHRSTQLLLHS